MARRWRLVNRREPLRKKQLTMREKPTKDQIRRKQPMKKAQMPNNASGGSNGK